MAVSQPSRGTMDDGAGDQVFSGDVNEILADKIVRHTRRHAHVAVEEPSPRGKRGAARRGGHGFLLPAAVLTMVAVVGLAYLVFGREKRQ